MISDIRRRFQAAGSFTAVTNYFSNFWIINVGIGFGGGKVLNKFTAILNPCIYIVFGGMAIWAISLVGIGPILDYLPSGVQKQSTAAFCSRW